MDIIIMNFHSEAGKKKQGFGKDVGRSSGGLHRTSPAARNLEPITILSFPDPPVHALSLWLLPLTRAATRAARAVRVVRPAEWSSRGTFVGKQYVVITAQKSQASEIHR